MSKYRIVIECDGPFLPDVNVTPTVADDGSIFARLWLGREYWQDDIEFGQVYEDSPGPLVVVAGNTGGNPNGVPGSVSVSVERVRVHIGAPPCALCGEDIWGELSFVSKGREVCADCRFALEVKV